MLLLALAAAALAGCSDVDDLLHPSRTYQTASSGKVCRYYDAASAGAAQVCTYDCGGGSTVATAVRTGAACPQTIAYP
jgi:hypothetical protein